MTEVQRILDALNMSELVVLSGDFEGIYEELVADAGITALAQLGISDADTLNQVNEKAVEWAKGRAAEMVGKKWVNGELVDNPDAYWRIDESTRSMLADNVTQAIEEGWSNDRLASEIAESYAFSDERADMIARTETAFADIQGNMIAYRESGVVSKKQWITGDGCCEECAQLNGQIVGIDESFDDGVDEPPLHPNCRCDVLPVVDEPDETDETTDEME